MQTKQIPPKIAEKYATWWQSIHEIRKTLDEIRSLRSEHAQLSESDIAHDHLDVQKK